MNHRIITGLYFTIASLFACAPVFFLQIELVDKEHFIVIGLRSIGVSMLTGMFFSPFAFFWGAVLSKNFQRFQNKGFFVQIVWASFIGFVITFLTAFSVGAMLELHWAGFSTIVNGGFSMVIIASAMSSGSIYIIGMITGIIRGIRLISKSAHGCPSVRSHIQSLKEMD